MCCEQYGFIYSFSFSFHSVLLAALTFRGLEALQRGTGGEKNDPQKGPIYPPREKGILNLNTKMKTHTRIIKKHLIAC